MKLLLICSFLLTVCFAKSQNNYLQLSDSLYNKQQFFEASIYAEYVLFQSSILEDKAKAIELKIDCLKKLKQYNALIAFITNCYSETIPEKLRVKLVYEEILANYFLKNYRQSIHLSQYYPATNYKEHQFISILNIIAYNHLEDWKTADSLWKLFTVKEQLFDTVSQQLYTHLPKFKNERKAANLSAYLPGMGQVYAGKPLEGIASFVFQVGSIGLGLEWWNRGYKFAAIAITGSSFSSFNDGGKKRAKKLVQDYNAKKIATFNASLNAAIVNATKHLFTQ